MNERPSNVLPAPGVVGGGNGKGKQRRRWGGTAGSRGVRTALREDRGRDQVSGYGSELTGDTAGRKVVVQCVYGVCEGKHGGPPVGIGSHVRGGRKSRPLAGEFCSVSEVAQAYRRPRLERKAKEGCVCERGVSNLSPPPFYPANTQPTG